MWVNAEEVDHHDPYGNFVDYTRIVTESFDTVDLSSDPLWKLETSSPGAAWATTAGENDDALNPTSTKSASPTAGNSYSAGQRSWMFYGPVDLSDYVEADVLFGLNYNLIHTEGDHHSENDWLGLCAFASAEPLSGIAADDVHFDHCDWWSDHTGSTWTEGHHDLTAFAGRSQVYLAFYFEANNDNPAGGVYVDELVVEGHHKDVNVPAPITFHPDGLELTNGNFANGLTGWNKETPAGKSGDVTVVDGRAALTGNQRLLHNFNVAGNTVGLNVHFNYSVETTEFSANVDNFCVHLAPAGNHSTILADVGCWDASHMPEFASDGDLHDSFGYSIPHEVIKGMQGQAVTLVVELTQNDSQPTTLYLDEMVVYSQGETPRDPIAAAIQAAATGAVNDVAAHNDANEPNGTNTTATTLACNQSKAGVFGDVLPTANKDFDVFKMERVPVGALIVDVDAATLQPASSADTALYLYDASFIKIGTFDDDGATLDSLMNYDNTVEGATYYLALYNFNTDGPSAYYTFNAKCGQTEAPPAAAPVLAPPSQPSGANKSWTMILYMNGEDQGCVTSQNPAACWDKATYEKAVQEIEKFIGAKQGIMNVVALIDGPNYPGTANDVTRYVVQPNGAYTLNINKWNLDEINMGDPKTLVDFANWTIANYPADHYYLSIDDHGGGMDGTGWDHHGVGGAMIDDQITPSELRSAIKQISRDGTRKIDIFAFESCLMGLFENAYDLKPYADYIAMFQTISWTALQYPEYFKNLTATDTVEQVAKRIIQTYPVSSTGTPYTFGLIQTDKLETVKTRLDAFATALMGADLATLTTIRNATQAFRGSPLQGDATTDWQGNLDMWDFAQRVKVAGIAVNEATALQAAIDAAVIEKKAVLKGRTPVWDYSNYHGLSFVYPNGAYNSLSTYCQNYSLSDHGQGGWSKFLTNKAFVGYVWTCTGGTAAVQSAALQAAGLRLLHAPVFLEPRPQADEQGPFIYLPVITK
ncbi:clostripain-related cysteine peptidase [Caldilinea sp.]|uniref:clostripain-related cysteine peptidase n=1 Tax=Caldilinea sp. TaxID=2293560 RepID=UPI002C25934A|nr:clostripain-related cysteine peptidase [Caldilinea sp.]